MAQADRKVLVKSASMEDEMLQDAINFANQALDKYQIEKEIAAYIKMELNKKYNPAWYCIASRNFNVYLPNKIEYHAYFYIGKVPILIYKGE